MKIGDLAQKTGCKVVTIRYYEKEGLLSEPQRTEKNYRVYTDEDLERLEFIMHCRRHDMSLSEVRELLAFKDKPRRDCSWVSDLIDSHIQGVDAQIKSLEHLKLHLQQLKQRCSGGKSGEECGILQSLNRQDVRCENCEKAQVAVS